MKPSIAVMLEGKGKPEEDDGEPGMGESKASALDAARALAGAVASKDAEGIYRAFRSLSTLCQAADDLEDSGESDEPEPSEMKDEADSDEE